MIEVWFMPWAGLSEKVDVGPVSIWPFDMYAPSLISNSGIRNELQDYFNCYVDRGQPVDTVAVCSHKSARFTALSAQETLEVRRAVDCLIVAISTASSANAFLTGKGPLTDEDLLLLYGHRISTGKVGLVYRRVIDLAYIGQLLVQKPLSLFQKIGRPEWRLLPALGKSIRKRISLGDKDRLFRSLEWFRFAHVNSQEISDFSRVVMMATAFELLLGLTKESPGKKMPVIQAADLLCGESTLKRRTRTYKNKKQQVKKVILSARGAWFWDFYGLRNDVAHGSPSRAKLNFSVTNGNAASHLLVADLVFRECLVHFLLKHHCDAGPLEHLKGFTKQDHMSVIDTIFDFSKIHKKLGWLK